MTGSRHQVVDCPALDSFVIWPLCIEVAVDICPLALELLIRRLCLRDVLFPGHLRSPSPPRDQPTQGVHSQSDEEGQHQVPQHDPCQHAWAQRGAVAFPLGLDEAETTHSQKER